MFTSEPLNTEDTMSRKQDAEQTLVRGMELIATPCSWIQKDYSLDDIGGHASVVSERASRFCMNGTLIRAANEVCSQHVFVQGLMIMSGGESMRAFRAHETAIDIVSDLLGFDYEIAKRSIDCSNNQFKERERWVERWNDNADRTHSEVVEVLHKAIAQVQA